MLAQIKLVPDEEFKELDADLPASAVAAFIERAAARAAAGL